MGLPQEIIAQGIDSVACVAVNDAFVLKAWSKAMGCEQKIDMLADGGCKFAHRCGLVFDTGAFGGERLRRFALLVQDGIIRIAGFEEGGALTEKSSAEGVLQAIIAHKNN